MRRGLLDQFEPFDVIHVHRALSPLTWIGFRLAAEWGVPVFVQTHGELAPDRLGRRGPRALLERGYLRVVELTLLKRAAALSL